MPSFDVVNRVNMQEVDNAVNITRKEVSTRYDFRGFHTEATLHKNENKIHLVASDEMKMKALRDMLVGNFVRRKVDPKCLDFKDTENTSAGNVKRDVLIQEGIDKEMAKKIVKRIKGEKLKVQAAIQDNQVRVTGKKIDDLQHVIKLLKDQNYNIPLQFVNMKK